MAARRRSPKTNAKQSTKGAENSPRPRRRIRAVACFLCAAACGGLGLADWWQCLPDDATATYVGRQSCIECHSQEAQLYHGSHHDLAMDRASDETVLGDFDDAELTHYGTTSRMFLRDSKYMIHTEGPDGELGDFEIKYVFGVEPLQQYMVEFDRVENMSADEVARLQVLRVSWDTVKQRWFYLSPPDVDEKLAPHDDLHWTGIAQRWNNMCADCHSTNLQKNFDPHSKTYRTTFSEIDVSCEACHGPGSLHLELAQAKSLFWDRKRGYGLARLKDRNTDVEIHACAQCHSRRRVVYPNFRPGQEFYDYFDNELLMAHTYHADGQILDEVYVHGSFIQSKMYHKDIRCTDCHDPHTARLKHSGNQVCTSCHQHSSGKYDTPAHHSHKVDSPGASCVACHMPATTYMQVDPRRDHSLRVPRPDLSVRLGTPNACSGCHLERADLDPDKRDGLPEYADWLTAARNGDEQVQAAIDRVDLWASEKFVELFGKSNDSQVHFADALTSARRGDRQSAAELVAIARSLQSPAIARATALMELARFQSNEVINLSTQLLEDRSPQVRATALGNLFLLRDQNELVAQAGPLLEDPVRTVRTEAARILARVDPAALRVSRRRALRRCVEELEQGLMVNNDRAAAHLSWGVLRESMGDDEDAAEAYQMAIHVEPSVAGARTNLAALYDRRIAQSGQLSNALRQELAQVAARLRREELDLLHRDAQLAPNSAAIQYRYGMSLYLHDRLTDAEQALTSACELEPNTPDFSLAISLLLQKLGRYTEALGYAERVVQLRPSERGYQNLVRELRRQVSASGTVPTN